MKEIKLVGYLVLDKDEKDYIVCKNKKQVIYRELKEREGENYKKIRGYTIDKSK